MIRELLQALVYYIAGETGSHRQRPEQPRPQQVAQR